jgi:phosphoribosylamine--glycine ligase/phosphoribosylformylglycinamidine cyclo-ligase
MRILVLGSGGREHALVWKLSQSTAVEKIFLAPGNGGSHQEEKTINVKLDIADFPALVKFAAENEVRSVTTFLSPCKT